MAVIHKSTIKRARQSKVLQKKNRAKKLEMKTTVKNLLKAKSKDEAAKQYPAVISLLDRLAQKRIIHKNKARRAQSRLAKQINKRAAK